MSVVESLLIALAPSLAKLIENSISDTYDKDTEYQALLEMQDAVARERAKRIAEG